MSKQEMGQSGEFHLTDEGVRIFDKRIITLFEMQQFYASRFVNIFQLLEHIKADIDTIPNVQGAPVSEMLIKSIRMMLTECNDMNLTVSAAAANRIILRFENGADVGHLLSYGELRSHIEILNERIIDELNGLSMYRFEAHEVPYLTDPLPEWKKVEKAFQSATTDIYEAAKCYAVMRYPASVFHCMRVVEIGLHSISNDLKITLKQTPTWNDIINAISGYFREKHKVKHGGNAEGWKKEEPFYSEVIASVTAMKDAWRNKIMHVNELGVDLFYQPDTAKRIYDATRNFMEVLATKPITATVSTP